MSRIHHFYVGLSGRLSGEMGRALIRTFIARGIAALGALVLTVVIGRLYGPEGVGVYALAYGLLLGLGTLSRCGMDNALMRYVGQEYDSPYVLLYLRWVGVRSLAISLIAAVILLAVRNWLQVFFDADDLSEILVGIAFATPAYTFGFLLSGFFKGIRRPATGCLLENGSIALVAGALILAWEWSEYAGGLEVIGYSYAVASWLVFIQGSYQLWRWCKCQPWWQFQSKPIGNSRDAPVSLSQFMTTSRAFFITNLANFSQSVLGVMIAGLLLTSGELGLFKSSQQTAMLIGFILIVINAIFPPRFALLYHQGKTQALGRLARQGAMIGAVVAAPLLIVCLLFPAWVLSWFGPGFQEGAPLLRIIAIAQLVNVSTGSVGFLLNMTGNEKLMRNIAIICNALGLLGFFIFIPFFGALGAAIALAFFLVVQNLTAMVYVWKRLGIWTLPGPNILCWLGVKGHIN